MRAAVYGGKSALAVADVPVPQLGETDVLIAVEYCGICGTDLHLVLEGWGAPGQIGGHEYAGRVAALGPHVTGWAVGDLVVGGPMPCGECAFCTGGRPSLCRRDSLELGGDNPGAFAEYHRVDVAALHRVPAGLSARVAALTEPLAVAMHSISRSGVRPGQRVLVSGAGPIGLLAALLGTERGLDVHVYDLATTGPKPALVHALGATYHTGDLSPACAGADAVIECTGVGQVVFDVMGDVSPDGIVCLVGVASAGRRLSVDAGALNTEMVLGNRVVFGSVNANRSHYETAAASLARADGSWLEGLITRRVPLAKWSEALERQDGDVKVVIDFDAG